MQTPPSPSSPVLAFPDVVLGVNLPPGGRPYIAAIAARRDSDDVPLGRHRLVSSFLHGAKRLRPVCPPSFPSWNLSVVLKGLLGPPFEPLESAPVRILTQKVTLLLAFNKMQGIQACG